MRLDKTLSHMRQSFVGEIETKAAWASSIVALDEIDLAAESRFLVGWM